MLKGDAFLKKYLYVGGFGFFGAILRFTIKNIHIGSFGAFPINTIIINLTGSFALAIAYAITNKKQLRTEVVLGITTGLIGTYTTFATFSKDIFTLIEKGSYEYSMVYVLVSIVISMLLVLLGNKLGSEIL